MKNLPYAYIKKDSLGFPFNSIYPPTGNSEGGLYHGYRNNTEETFFYDFAVQRYDLRFVYEGNEYYFLSTDNYVAQCDEKFTNELQRYVDGNDVLERFTIKGVRLLTWVRDKKVSIKVGNLNNF